MQHPGNKNHLEHQRQRTRHIEVGLVRGIAQQKRGATSASALHHEQVDQRDNAPLRDHGERQQQDQRGKQVDQLGRKFDHPDPQQDIDQQTDHGHQKRGAQKLGHPKNPHLGAQGFNQGQHHAAHRQLDHQHRQAPATAPAAHWPRPRPKGKTAPDQCRSRQTASGWRPIPAAPGDAPNTPESAPRESW